MTTLPSEWQIWLNPRCSKSKQALEILREHGVEPQQRLYLQDPPTAAELLALLAKLGLTARQLLRTQEPVYLEEGLQDLSLGDDIVLAAIVRQPILLQRPLVLHGGRGVIARPPERVAELFDQA